MKKNIAFMKLFEKEGLPAQARKALMQHKKRLMETDFCLVKDIIEQGIKNNNVSYKLNDSLVLID